MKLYKHDYWMACGLVEWKGDTKIVTKPYKTLKHNGKKVVYKGVTFYFDNPGGRMATEETTGHGIFRDYIYSKFDEMQELLKKLPPVMELKAGQYDPIFHDVLYDDENDLIYDE